MVGQFNNRQRVHDLLRAEVAKNEIAEIVGVNIRTVRRIESKLKAGKGLERSTGSGRPRNKRTGAFIKDLESEIRADPTQSMERLSRKLEVSRRTVQRATYDDLGFKSYVRTQRHFLSSIMKEKRLERCRKLINYLRKRPSIVKIFSDEKIFTVDQVYNRRNDRYIAESRDQVKGVYRTKHPAQIMVLGVLTSDGRRMPPHFFKPNQKIGTEEYLWVLRYKILPWIKCQYPH